MLGFLRKKNKGKDSGHSSLEQKLEALMCDGGESLFSVLKFIRFHDAGDPDPVILEKIGRNLGKEYEVLFRAVFEERKGNLIAARNLYDSIRDSSDSRIRFLASYYVALIGLKEGAFSHAFSLLDSLKDVVPDDYREEFFSNLKLAEKGKESSINAFVAGFTKTRKLLSFPSFFGKKVDEGFIDDLEEKLVLADVGVKATLKLTKPLRKLARRQKVEADVVISDLKNAMKGMLSRCTGELNLKEGPTVILVLGVNGVGKTTTVGKLAKLLTDSGRKVVIAAADTFRAGATQQLAVWSERAGVRMVRGDEGADPASVVFDAIQSLRARGEDVLLVDTAGRLHNKGRLMKELQKIKKVISRELFGEPSEILLVLDANTGQNAISQARTFKEFVNVTGVVLTKLDGTAKGGIVVAVCEELGIPVKYVGVGEGIYDLKHFDPDAFVESLFGV